jgi:hypothetical protein
MIPVIAFANGEGGFAMTKEGMDDNKKVGGLY